jgi:hypothetical protein
MPVNTLIQMRRDTTANWKNTNPLLAAGEIGLELDTDRTKIGNGIHNWNELVYQSIPFYAGFQDLSTQTIASTTTAYPITMNTMDFSHGIRLDQNYASRIIFDHFGVYNLQWSGQFKSISNSATDVVVWIRKNGIDIPGSAGQVTVPARHGSIDGATIAAWNYFVQVLAGDYIEFMWHSNDTGVTLEYYAPHTSPTAPATASMIVTVAQVA